MNFLSKLVVVIGLSSLALTGCKKEKTPADLARSEGNKLWKDKKWAEAADAYARSLQADPNQPALWEKKAMAHHHAGQFDKYDESMIKLAEMKADPVAKADVYRNIAGSYISKGESMKSEEFFAKALEYQPNDNLSLAWMGEIYAQRGGARGKVPVNMGHLEKAFEYYDRAIASKPEEPNSYVNKRIAVIKYLDALKTEKERAEAEVAATKNKQIKAELQANVDNLQARLDELKAHSDLLLATYKEKAKAAKEAQANAPKP